MSRFLLTRGVASAAAVLVALAEDDAQRLLIAGAMLYVGVALLGGPSSAVKLLGATLAMALPLALVHGFVNPAFVASHVLLGLPFRADGFRYAMEISSRFGLLFGVVGFWLGTPRRTWLAIVAASRLPPAWAMAMLQAVALTNVLSLKITRIRQAQRSRGILRDDMGFVARASATAAMVVPLVAITLIDANERGALLHRMGFGTYKLLPATPLGAPNRLDVAYSFGIAAVTAVLLMI
jgi:energy-coupling factor transporter transmembrane protein EcfT